MKLFKKVSAVLLSFCLLFGLIGATNTSITAKASTQPVQLYYLDHLGGKYGMSKYNVYVKINHNAANKAVYLHYYTQNGRVWLDEQGQYVTTLSDGSEIWKVTPSSAYGTLYCIKYVGDNQTYWDNNNGNNYDSYDVLGNDVAIKLQRHSGPSRNQDGTSTIYVGATVKNLAYDKVVKVRYTEDNWATYHDVALNYTYELTGTNNEVWNGSITINTNNLNSFHYCASYTVNNTTYWDNNFFANYDINYIFAPY